MVPVTPRATPSLNNNVALIGYDPIVDNRGPFINDGKNTGVEGNTPYLNSLHPGIVVVTLCDGSVRTISESIDQGVYLRLITPNGTRLRSTIGGEDPVDGNSF